MLQKKTLYALSFLAVASGIFAATLTPSVKNSYALHPVYAQLANVVGLTVGVAPNEYNMLAQQFEEREGELNVRELALLEREWALTAQYEDALAANNRLAVAIFSGVTLLLVLLIVMNFYLDWKREHKGEPDNPHIGEFQTRL